MLIIILNKALILIYNIVYLYCGIMIYQLFCQKTMPYINPEDRHQLRMESYEDSIPPDSYVRLIDLIVEKIVQENPEECKRCEVFAAGPQTYRTETLLKLFIYGYYNSIKSSR
jgi:hypothetical protein